MSTPSRTFESTDWPAVSLVMPVLNEETYLRAAVDAILAQDYPGQTEVVLALGPSRDATDRVAEQLAAEHPQVRLVHNPGVDIPKGMNLCIKATRYPIVARVDAHSELPPDYLRIAVRTLHETGAANVGGLMVAKGRTRFQRAVARAYNSKYGLGGSAYHSGATPGPCESAYLGVFRRDVLAEVGGYDESIRRGEDWELNLRIRKAGHMIWFTPELQTVYWPRESVQKLARQFWSTGVWRGALTRSMLRQTPTRFFVPGALVAALLLSALVGVSDTVGRLRGPAVLLRGAYLGPITYGGLLAGLAARSPGSLLDRVCYVLAILTMHLSWGTGWWVGMLRGGGDTVDTSRAG
ncbi:glycosyltransferase family 2 protein [Granulicoccus phenolivorans]|uniref:glycosyltransferase family 2 protein n=1 Tax=Granulicoccus phenolivorans TaxID=266854 RepID=UPI0004168700|nr:glycosyltransferase family 2 protein [Granulicoccus phenolivorans]